jgi:hypothetical protein
VPDERKLDIGPLLRLCGEEIPQDDYVRAFLDYEGSRRRRRNEAVRRAPATPEEVTEHLIAAGVIEGDPDDGRTVSEFLDVAEAAAVHNPPLGAMMLAAVAAIAEERGIDDFPSARTISRIESTSTGEAAWFLRVLGELYDDALGAQSRAATGRLAAAGIVEAIPPAPPFERGWVTMVDGAGSRQLVLSFEEDRGAAGEMLFLLLNDQAGIKECFCRFACDAATRQLIEAELEVIARAPCGIALARALVAEALDARKRNGRPLAGALVLYRHLLGDEPLVAAAREPELGAYGLDGLQRDASLVDGSEDLADTALCQSLYCASDEAYRFVERLREQDDAALEPDADVLGEFATIALRDRPSLLRRLAVNLEVEALAGRAEAASNRRLARLYHGLCHEVVPFSDTPFVRALCDRAIRSIDFNLACGYRSQLDVNDAVLDAGNDDPF